MIIQIFQEGYKVLVRVKPRKYGETVYLNVIGIKILEKNPAPVNPPASKKRKVLFFKFIFTSRKLRVRSGFLEFVLTEPTLFLFNSSSPYLLLLSSFLVFSTSHTFHSLPPLLPPLSSPNLTSNLSLLISSSHLSNFPLI